MSHRQCGGRDRSPLRNHKLSAPVKHQAKRAISGRLEPVAEFRKRMNTKKVSIELDEKEKLERVCGQTEYKLPIAEDHPYFVIVDKPSGVTCTRWKDLREVRTERIRTYYLLAN